MFTLVKELVTSIIYIGMLLLYKYIVHICNKLLASFSLLLIFFPPADTEDAWMLLMCDDKGTMVCFCFFFFFGSV